MQSVAGFIASIFVLVLFLVLTLKEKKRVDEEKKQLKEWRDSVLDVLTSMKQRLVK